jgi:succinate dehydrogenase/fumarate reductase cytochrome b subunit
MKKIHYFSGLFITVFIAFHLLNHAFAIISLEKHLAVMDIFRVVYRNIIVESLLLLAVCLQIYSGIKLVLIARKTAITIFDKLHIYSGLYLAMFLLIHVSAVLSARVLFHLDSNSYFGAAALNHYPEIFFFVPYYFFAVLAFFVHVACIHFKKTTSKSQAYLIILFGFIIASILIVALTNRFHGYTIPEEYNKMLEAMSF